MSRKRTAPHMGSLSDALEGIEFEDQHSVHEPQDAPSKPEEEGDATRRVALNAANQQAARMAIEVMRQRQVVLPAASAQHAHPVLPPLPKEVAENLRPDLYRVMSDRTITRGAASYTLRQGKVVSANEYDIHNLRQQGVVLEQI